MTNIAGIPLLSLILFLPLAGALVLLMVNKTNENAIRWIANIVAFVGFLVSVPLWFGYDVQTSGFQFVEHAPWIAEYGIWNASNTPMSICLGRFGSVPEIPMWRILPCSLSSRSVSIAPFSSSVSWDGLPWNWTTSR